ncbi:MAG: MotA/TolQ/ExbB proton channel family protein [Planctomycetota bacterium]|nr:MAG: MotA/TolQ/ExbB proton channel family protein [Planctomycetota bacterium]
MMPRLRTFLLVTVLLFLSAAWLPAQDGAAEPAFADSMSIGLLITGGGWIGYIIILFSVVGVTLVVEHFVNIKREKLAPPEVVDEVETLLNEGNYQEVLEYCEANPNYFTRVVAAGVRKIGHPYDTIMAAVREMQDEEATKLSAHISWLSLVSAVGPMMGLFGTVWGMVGAFLKIASAGAGGVEPSAFAEDISLALITTVQGLIVAIPMTTFFAYFRNKLTVTLIECEGLIADIFERFRPAAPAA